VADIFDEVQEDLRAERAQALLRRYGGAAIGVAVAVVVAVGAWQAWQWNQARQTARIADTYLAAMAEADAIPAAGDPAKRDQAAAQFMAVAANGTEGYRTLARFRAAALKSDAGDHTTALALWDQVAGDGGADPLLRDLATLLWVQHQLDSADPALLQARLGPLTQPDNAWHAFATEASALVDLRAGKPDDARQLLQRLAADGTAPDGVRGRANALLAGMAG
jgi:hypothetical protein